MRFLQREYRVDKKVIYKTVDGIDLWGDFYFPVDDSTGDAKSSLKPTVLVVHGGSWTSRQGDMSGICIRLAKEGFIAFNVTYRLAPKHLYPKAVEDVRDAAKFLQDHSARLGINPAQITAWGYSAGAHLALMVGLDPSNKISKIVAGGTPADLPAWPVSPIVRKFLGFTFQERPDLWAQASPINHVQTNSPPVFMYHGTRDALVEVEHMYKMRDVLRTKGIPVETHEVTYFGHILIYLFSPDSIRRGIQFLRG